MADYSAELLRALEPLGSVKVNARDADVPLYHLGNNPLHGEIYGQALKTPGVAVLHDAVLHHFFLGSGNEREYVAEFVYNYGHWSEDLARELWRRRSRSAADPEYFRYPMIKRVAERSRAVIVHNPRAAALVQEHVRGTTVHEIPLLFTLPADLPSQSDVIRWRAGLGISPRTFLVGVFGHLRETKRLLALLRAFQRARQRGRYHAAGGGRFRFVRSGSLGRTAARQRCRDFADRLSRLSATSGCAPPRWTLASTCGTPWRAKLP